MNFKDLVAQNRTRRRFYEDRPVSRQALEALVDLARLAPCGANKQPLKYALVCDPALNAQVFPLLGWAGYLKDWPGPVEGERPAAYIVILGDPAISGSFGVDHGIAAQTIMLGAVELGLGGCIIATVRHPELRQVLSLPESLQILLVLALGVPKEQVVVDEIGPDGDIRYYRDAQEVHHVPKRALRDILVN